MFNAFLLPNLSSRFMHFSAKYFRLKKKTPPLCFTLRMYLSATPSMRMQEAQCLFSCSVDKCPLDEEG